MDEQTSDRDDIPDGSEPVRPAASVGRATVGRASVPGLVVSRPSEPEVVDDSPPPAVATYRATAVPAVLSPRTADPPGWAALLGPEDEPRPAASMPVEDAPRVQDVSPAEPLPRRTARSIPDAPWPPDPRDGSDWSPFGAKAAPEPPSPVEDQTPYRVRATARVPVSAPIEIPSPSVSAPPADVPPADVPVAPEPWAELEPWSRSEPSPAVLDAVASVLAAESSMAEAAPAPEALAAANPDGWSAREESWRTSTADEVEPDAVGWSEPADESPVSGEDQVEPELFRTSRAPAEPVVEFDGSPAPQVEADASDRDVDLSDSRPAFGGVEPSAWAAGLSAVEQSAGGAWAAVPAAGEPSASGRSVVDAWAAAPAADEPSATPSTVGSWAPWPSAAEVPSAEESAVEESAAVDAWAVWPSAADESSADEPSGVEPSAESSAHESSAHESSAHESSAHESSAVEPPAVVPFWSAVSDRNRGYARFAPDAESASAESASSASPAEAHVPFYAPSTEPADVSFEPEPIAPRAVVWPDWNQPQPPAELAPTSPEPIAPPPDPIVGRVRASARVPGLIIERPPFMDRPGAIERSEGMDRPEAIERSEGMDRPEAADRPEGMDRSEAVEPPPAVRRPPVDEPPMIGRSAVETAYPSPLEPSSTVGPEAEADAYAPVVVSASMLLSAPASGSGSTRFGAPATPTYGSPAGSGPVYGSPVDNGPIYGGPVDNGPMYGGPADDVDDAEVQAAYAAEQDDLIYDGPPIYRSRPVGTGRRTDASLPVDGRPPFTFGDSIGPSAPADIDEPMGGPVAAPSAATYDRLASLRAVTRPYGIDDPTAPSAEPVGEDMDRPLAVPRAIAAQPAAEQRVMGPPPDLSAVEGLYSNEDWRSNVRGSSVAGSESGGTVYRGEAEEDDEDEPLSLGQRILRGGVVLFVLALLVVAFIEGPKISAWLHS